RPSGRARESARASAQALFLLVRRAGAGRADEELLPVRKGDVPGVGRRRSVLRLKTVDDELSSHGNGVLVQAAPDQRVGGAAFDRPCLDLAIRALHIDMDPGMGVNPLGFLHRST